MAYKLSVILKSEISSPLERAAQYLNVSVAVIVREALAEKLATYRHDPDFQAKRRAWLQTDDGFAVEAPVKEEPIEEAIIEHPEASSTDDEEEPEPPLEDRDDEVQRIMARQKAAAALIS